MPHEPARATETPGEAAQGVRSPLTVASFFSGVGLLDLGLEWAGFRTVSFSEIDPYASRILSLRFPGVPNLGDIHAIESVSPATVWAGGFPCQPVSVAGRLGAQSDARWLWPRWVELIRVFRPRYLFLENVANLLAVNRGGAFGDVLGDLAASGYDAEWDCIPAEAVGAPHERDRVWIVAYAAGERPGEARGLQRGGPQERATRGGQTHVALAGSRGGERRWAGPGRAEGAGAPRPPAGPGHQVPDTRGQRGLVPPERAFAAVAQPGSAGPARSLAEFRRASSRWWAAEPGLGRVAHGVPHRVDRLRCLGNGVVPQVAEFIGWRLRAMIEGEALERAA